MRMFWNRCRAVVVIVCLGFLAGCVTDPVPQKKTENDSLSTQARRLRENSTDRPGAGLSSVSRDIENNLGYR